MEQSIIAERLTSLRKKAGVSQAAVAERLAVSRQAVSKWESGKAAPSLAVYGTLAALYHTTPDIILTGEAYSSESEVICEGDSFAERLRSLRSYRGVSQGELAEALEVSRQSVSKWERGEAEPDADRLIALSRRLDAPIACLIPCDPPCAEEALEEQTLPCGPPCEEKALDEETPCPSPEVNEPEPSVTLEEDDPEPSVTFEENGTERTAEKPHRSPAAEKRFQKMKAHVREIRRKKRQQAESAAKEAEETEAKIPELSPNEMAYIYVDKKGGKVHTVLPFLAALPLGATALLLMLKKKKK